MHRASLTAVGGLLIAWTMGRPLGAQDRSLVELGVSALHFPAEDVSAAGPSIRWLLARERGPASASLAVGAVAGTGGASGFVDVSGRRHHALAAGWRVEVGGEIDALLATATRAAGTHAASGIASGRLIRPIGNGGLWVGGSGSVSQREHDRLGGRGAGGGAWWRWSTVQLVGTLARAWTEAQLFTEPHRGGYAGTVPVRYVEGALVLEMEGDDATFALAGTLRRDPGADRLIERGVAATAVLWNGPTRAFLISASSQLPDFVRGADAARSITVGIRLREPSPRMARVARMRPVVHVRGEGEQRTLTVRAPGARRVEVMGDFTGWEPIELTGSGALFSLVVAVESGTRRIVVRVDGGEWTPAANTPAVDDDFGGRVGLLVVP